MRTVRSSGRISGGGVCLGWGGYLVPGGAPGRGDVPGPGGVHLVWGGGVPGQVPPLPPVDRHMPVKT